METLDLDWIQMLTGLCGGLALFLFGLGRKWVEKDLRASEAMMSLLNELFEGVYAALEKTVFAIKENDESVARDTISMKNEINRRVNAALTARPIVWQ